MVSARNRNAWVPERKGFVGGQQVDRHLAFLGIVTDHAVVVAEGVQPVLGQSFGQSAADQGFFCIDHVNAGGIEDELTKTVEFLCR